MHYDAKELWMRCMLLVHMPYIYLQAKLIITKNEEAGEPVCSLAVTCKLSVTPMVDTAPLPRDSNSERCANSMVHWRYIWAPVQGRDAVMCR